MRLVSILMPHSFNTNDAPRLMWLHQDPHGFARAALDRELRFVFFEWNDGARSAVALAKVEAFVPLNWPVELFEA